MFSFFLVSFNVKDTSYDKSMIAFYNYCIHIIFTASQEDNIIFLLDINRGGAIFRMNLHTQSYVQIPINPLYTPTAFDYEPSEGRIYFVDPRLHQIVSVHFSGTDIRELQQLGSSEYGVFGT